MQPVTIAVIQTNSQNKVQANLDQLEGFINDATSHSVDIILLPESFALMNALTAELLEQAALEKTAEGPVRSWLAKMSQQYQVWIVAGGLAVGTDKDKDRCCMRCLVFNNQGQEVGFYDKIHLFDVDLADQTRRYRESETYLAGKKPVVISTPWGKMGLSICYDLRFCELYQQMSELSVDWFCVPAAFTKLTGQAHWEVLLRARAIENQAFVVAAGQTGRHGKTRETWGHSMIVDPWGQKLCELNEQTGWVKARLLPSRLDEVRQGLPCLKHHRLNRTKLKE